VRQSGIFSPANSVSSTCSGGQFSLTVPFDPEWLAASTRSYRGSPKLACEFAVDFAGIAAHPRCDFPPREQAGTIPSLSVVQTVPSKRAKRCPGALFASAAKANRLAIRQRTLKADRHLVELPAKFRGERSIIWLLTHRLADCRLPLRHFGRCWKR